MDKNHYVKFKEYVMIFVLETQNIPWNHCLSVSMSVCFSVLLPVMLVTNVNTGSINKRKLAILTKVSCFCSSQDTRFSTSRVISALNGLS